MQCIVLAYLIKLIVLMSRLIVLVLATAEQFHYHLLLSHSEEVSEREKLKCFSWISNWSQGLESLMEKFSDSCIFWHCVYLNVKCQFDKEIKGKIRMEGEKWSLLSTRRQLPVNISCLKLRGNYYLQQKHLLGPWK